MGEPTPLQKATSKLAGECEVVAEMARDPFKAPEQTVELVPRLLNACWELQLEWAVMRRVKAR